MLKDKYKYKFSQSEANSLNRNISWTLCENAKQKDLQIMLPISVLAEFYQRLSSKLIFPKAEIKIYLTRTEAIAFMFLYLTGYIETSNETQQIAHSIDTTL